MRSGAERALEQGRAARRRGDLREAARLVGKAFARAQRRDDRRGMADALVDVGLIALDGGDVDAAAEAVGRALVLGQDDGPVLAVAVAAAGRVALAAGDAETALRLHAGAERFATGEVLDRARTRVGPVDAEARARLGACAEEAGGWRADPGGAPLSADQVLALAVARCAR